MRLLIFAGFLGSGKTTLLLKVARQLVASSMKITIIENEMGEIGIDGDYLRLEGLSVQELFGGCICCTLSLGLNEMLEKVEKLYQPDLVILEATGAARAGDIITNIGQYNSKIEDIRSITLVDAVRYEMLMEMMTPLITEQIEAADIVAVNKIDMVDQETLDKIIKDVGRLNPSSKLVAISAEDQVNLKSLLGEWL